MAEASHDRPLSPPHTWQRSLRQGITRLAPLRSLGALDVASESDAQLTAQLAVRVPEAWREHWPTTPALARQVIPSAKELVFDELERKDPIGDAEHQAVPGVTHRYPDRVLLALNHHCAMYCRFCFRRESVSHKPLMSEPDLAGALAYIGSRPEIWEVILTGGDPLVLPDATLFRVLEALCALPHLACIRFHTRVPTALPDRITPAFTSRLTELSERTGKQFWMAVHINSDAEFLPATDAALRRLARAGIALVSQSVLLAGVNDSEAALESLLRGFVRRGVKPYYLHLLDLAQGTHHFRVPLDRALSLFGALRGRLPGTCLPTLMLDIPGGHGKIDAMGSSLRRITSTHWQAKSPLSGRWTDIHYPAS